MYLLQRFIKYVFALFVTALLFLETLDLLGVIAIETCFELIKKNL